VQAHRLEFERRAVSLVVVSFAEPAKLVYYQEQHQWPFPVLADPHRAAYHAFTLKRLSLLRVFSPATLKLYWKLLRSGHHREDYGKEDIYQAGGDFLVNREGQILFAHRSQDPTDRPSLRNLLDAVDRATKKTE